MEAIMLLRTYNLQFIYKHNTMKTSLDYISDIPNQLPITTKFTSTVCSSRAPEPIYGKLPFSLCHQYVGSSTLFTNKNVSSHHGNPLLDANTRSSHQQPSRHVSLHSSGPTTTLTFWRRIFFLNFGTPCI